MKIKPAIVVLAFNRRKSLGRLLESIAAAVYPERVKLYISLECGASNDVVAMARSFEAKSLDVHVISHQFRMGLRKHVIQCGELAIEHGGVIVLEDDLSVDRYFYLYTMEALSYYSSDAGVAGIALYSYENNEYAGLPFRPMRNGYTTYPMQVPCSSGQCWSANQWKSFKEWYASATNEELQAIEALPDDVKKWPESSWKKYFAAYLVLQNKHFIYPYESYSTNCSDPGGTHIVDGAIVHQVGLGSSHRPPPFFRFVPSENKEVYYDSFMEPTGEFVFRTLGLVKIDVAVDLQGIKPATLLKKFKYILTCKQVQNAIKSYPRSFRPPENNLLHPAVGNYSGGYALIRSIEFKKSQHVRSLEELSYFAGFKLLSRRVIGRMFIEVPCSIFRSIYNRIHLLLSNRK
jgi:hypothetical protein